MSFLNSVMSSIGEDDGKAAAARPTPLPKRSTPNPQTSSSLTSPALSKSAAGSGTPKRKAEQPDRPLAFKAPASGVGRPVSPAPSRSKTSSPAQLSGLAPPPRPLEPYKGTVRSAAQSKTVATSSKLSNGTAGRQPAPAAAPAPASASASAPKKGGYLAMLERAAKAQEAAKPFGQIKHQKTTEKERLSRREKERQAAEAAAAAKKDARTKSLSKAPAHGRNGIAAKAGVKSPEPKKRKVEVEYKGTMRAVPAKPAYTGTMRAGEANAQRGRGGVKNGRPSKQPSYRYAEDDEDEEEDESGDGYDEDSASSDMEAGLDEIDHEEMFSTRLAKKEDEEALQEENELKRAKLERKRKLEALNAAAAKKKKIY